MNLSHSFEQQTNLGDRLKFVFANNPSSCFGNMGVAVLFFLLASTVTESILLWVWLAYMLLVNGIRLFAGKYFAKQLLTASETLVLVQFFGILMLVALGWAAVSLLFYQADQTTLTNIILITISGIAAASISSLSAIKIYFHSFLTLLMLPLIVTFLLSSTDHQFLLAILIGVYWVFLAVTSNKTFQNILEVFQLNNRNLVLIDSLTEQKKQAEKANALKSEFLANISHEIRTPMNAILGFAQLLRYSETQPDKIQLIKSIQDSGENLLHIINDILDFSKLESGELNYYSENFSPRKVFKSVMDVFKIEAEQKQLQLNIEMTQNLPEVLYSDSFRIKQVFIKLISNAIKFSKPNTNIWVWVDYDVSNQSLKVQVKDEGIGIEPAKQQQIFEPFIQADNSTTREYGGTGLGLAICAKILQDLGGHLSLESELNQGSTFSFSLPCPQGNLSVSKAVESEKKISFKSLKGKVLIVEDDLTNQILLKKLLANMGISFQIAKDGIEAVEAYRQQDFDVILMDENMPRMSGIEATQAIREIQNQQNRNPQIIIALTANALKEDRARFLAAGMDEYLTKPIKIDVLNQTLSQFLPPA